ncbi:MAG: hypothetical protein ACJ8LM_15760 [Candidatus Udaeobacter sp.]
MIIRILVGVIGGIGVVGLVASLFSMMFSLFRMVTNRKDGVPLLTNWFEGPLGIIFRPEQLTDRGLAARRLSLRAMRWSFMFFLLGAIAALIGALNEVFLNPAT